MHVQGPPTFRTGACSWPYLFAGVCVYSVHGPVVLWGVVLTYGGCIDVVNMFICLITKCLTMN